MLTKVMCKVYADVCGINFIDHIFDIRRTKSWNYYSKTCLKQVLKRKTKIGFKTDYRFNAGQKYCKMLLEHFAILLTCIKLQSVFMAFVLFILEWPLKI